MGQNQQVKSSYSLGKFNFVLWKTYFDTGFGLTNYIKYAIALYGIVVSKELFNINKLLWIVVLYAISCFIIGYCWYRYGFKEAEIEVNNKFNLFVKEMRHKVIKKDLYS